MYSFYFIVNGIGLDTCRLPNDGPTEAQSRNSSARCSKRNSCVGQVEACGGEDQATHRAQKKAQANLDIDEAWTRIRTPEPMQLKTAEGSVSSRSPGTLWPMNPFGTTLITEKSPRKLKGSKNAQAVGGLAAACQRDPGSCLRSCPTAAWAPRTWSACRSSRRSRGPWRQAGSEPAFVLPEGGLMSLVGLRCETAALYRLCKPQVKQTAHSVLWSAEDPEERGRLCGSGRLLSTALVSAMQVERMHGSFLSMKADTLFVSLGMKRAGLPDGLAESQGSQGLFTSQLLLCPDSR